MIPNPITTALKAAPEHRAETVAFAVYASYVVLAEQALSIAQSPETPTLVRAGLVRAFRAINPVMNQIPALSRRAATRNRVEPNWKPDGTPTPESPGVSMLPNQVYAGPAGEIVVVTFTDRTSPPGGLSAVDYNFEVTIDGEPRRVSVRVLNEAIEAMDRWLADPANLFRIGGGGNAHELCTDVCIARILEAIHNGRGITRVLPEVTGAPEPISKAPPNAAMNIAIKDYIAQRTYAGWRLCGDSVDCAQQFTRVDWLYLKVTQRDLKKVIYQHRDVLWREVVQGQMYVTATPSLINELERPQVRAPVELTPFHLTGRSIPEGGRQAPASSAHPTRERVVGGTLSRLIEQEAARRGPLWKVIAVALALILAVLALL